MTRFDSLPTIPCCTALRFSPRDRIGSRLCENEI
jgi:hypothetical protein